MTTKTKEKSKEELDAEKRIGEAVTRINAALAETRTTLQPFMDASPLAIVPRVRVIIAQEESAPVEEKKEDLAKEVKKENARRK